MGMLAPWEPSAFTTELAALKTAAFIGVAEPMSSRLTRDGALPRSPGLWAVSGHEENPSKATATL